MCAEAAGWYLDYSKQRITDDTLRLLLKLDRSRESYAPSLIVGASLTW